MTRVNPNVIQLSPNKQATHVSVNRPTMSHEQTPYLIPTVTKASHKKPRIMLPYMDNIFNRLNPLLSAFSTYNIKELSGCSFVGPPIESYQFFNTKFTTNSDQN